MVSVRLYTGWRVRPFAAQDNTCGWDNHLAGRPGAALWLVSAWPHVASPLQVNKSCLVMPCGRVCTLPLLWIDAL